MKQKIFNFLLIVGAIITLNVLSASYFFRKDLTEEKRYTMADATQNLLQGLKEEVIIKVYLENKDFPPAFRRLHDAVQETLEEFKTYGGSKIYYVFIDPLSGDNDRKKNENIQVELQKKGMIPTNLVDNKNGRRVENIIYPYATVSVGGKERTVLLLKGNQAENAQEKLNQSYENIEYELASTIKKLSQNEKKKIGLLAEFTDKKPVNFWGLIQPLQDYYDLFIINAKESPSFLGLDALILPKPSRPIDDSTKYKIDQYIINGGNALMFLDGLKVDSANVEGTFAQPLSLNLEDMLFKYGIRINQNLVKDGISCAVIPMVVGAVGDKPNVQLMPYRYYPLINNFGKSLITNNLDLIYTKFPSSIDTVRADGILKIPLLLTSPYTKILHAPALITFNEARTETEKNDYKAGTKTIGLLLEGRFHSLYENRIMPADSRYKNFKAQGEAGKLIICSDGDIIVNEVDSKTGNPMPLGYDKYSKHTYGNLDFMMQAIDYMIDENGVISAKGKEIKLRPLDTLKVREERNYWQILNLGLPLVLLLIFGGINYWYRKHRYATSIK